MTLAAERVASTRVLLAAAVILKAGVWAIGLALVVFVVAATADIAIGLPLRARSAIPALALLAAIAAALVIIWRGRTVRSRERVALWVEERVPWMQYALVTSLDPRFANASGSLDAVIGEAQWGGVLALAAGRAVRVPAAVLLISLSILLALPDAAVSRVRDARDGDALARVAMPGTAPASRLETIVVAITPPAYSGQSSSEVPDPASVAALVGSRLVVRGRGDTAGMTAALGADNLPVADRDGQWHVATNMPARAAALRLRDGSRERLLVLEPRVDAAPVVHLSAPARDSVFRTPSGRLPLAARARDDIGIASAAFEYIISSGEGESFTFRSGVLGALSPSAGDRAVDMRAVFSLDSLGLGPGDIVHLRAVARDGNTVAGPSLGASGTRTLRIARSGEYDSVAVEGAAPPAMDSSLLSQSMLIMLAEALQERRPRLEREMVIAESRAIAGDQDRLRKRVAEVVFSRIGEDNAGEHSHGAAGAHDEASPTEALLTPEELLAAAEEATGHAMEGPIDFAEGESPVVAINRPLLEAYNFMWAASRELGVGEPDLALPPMRQALEALQRARQAERYYLRGRTPEIVVDIPRVRLQGAGEADPAPGRARVADESPAARRIRRFAAALGVLERSSASGAGAGAAPGGGGAVDSLLLLRVDALVDAPVLAAALGEAIDALRNGRDATAPLLRARRLLAGPAIARDALGAWGREW
ncbi:MAG: hypothetical protein ACRENI_07570 [Gemmatimonadaceae bacterium]